MAEISPKHMAQAIYGAIKGKSVSEIERLLWRSVRVLRDKKILDKSEEVLLALRNLADKETGTVRAKVISAKSLPSGEREKLEQEIKEKYGARAVESEFFERPELLGGVRIEVGDEITDVTYRDKSRKLQKFLMKQV